MAFYTWDNIAQTYCSWGLLFKLLRRSAGMGDLVVAWSMNTWRHWRLFDLPSLIHMQLHLSYLMSSQGWHRSMFGTTSILTIRLKWNTRNDGRKQSSFITFLWAFETKRGDGLLLSQRARITSNIIFDSWIVCTNSSMTLKMWYNAPNSFELAPNHGSCISWIKVYICLHKYYNISLAMFPVSWIVLRTLLVVNKRISGDDAASKWGICPQIRVESWNCFRVMSICAEGQINPAEMHNDATRKFSATTAPWRYMYSVLDSRVSQFNPFRPSVKLSALEGWQMSRRCELGMHNSPSESTSTRTSSPGTTTLPSLCRTSSSVRKTYLIYGIIILSQRWVHGQSPFLVT